MKIDWVNHKGKKILHADFRNTESEELVGGVDQVEKAINGAGGKVLILWNFEGVQVDGAFMDRIKQLGKEVLKEKAEKSAILGIDKLRAILLKAYNKFSGDNLSPFKTEAEALDWLAE